MTYHRYYSISVILLRIIGNIFLVVGLFFAAVLIIGLLRVLYDLILNLELISLEDVFGVAFMGIFCLFFGAISPNLFPNVAVDEKGLYVRFYLKWLFVPWQDVVSFRESFISRMNPFSRRMYFVLIRRGLTPFHWLVSLNQLGGWGPGFLVSSSITDYQDLVRTIREHVGTR